ncbi:MAG: endolytic transglycosylase MltG [Candidatus Uhrbacteria bacterium]
MSRNFWRLPAVIFFLAVFVFGWIFVSKSWFGSMTSPEPAVFVVQEGENSSVVIDHLKAQHVISFGWMYRMYGWIDRSVSRPKPGEYSLRAGSSFHDISRELALGPSRREVQVRVVEGRTVDELVEQLNAEQNIATTSTQSLVGRSANRKPFDSALRKDYPFLQMLPGNRSLEGYLFPDTYRVWGDQLPEGLIRKQLDEFGARFGQSIVTKKSAPLATLDDAVILASIVEAEVRDDADRRIVAGIFLNRLRDGMALQTDATLSYVTGSDRARANTADLQIESPFNTYKNRGLPPAPINSPGASAIEAVLNPATTDYLYFLTDAAGKVYYARTLDEHSANRRKAGF